MQFTLTNLQNICCCNRLTAFSQSNNYRTLHGMCQEAVNSFSAKNSRDKAVIKVYNVPQKSDALYSAEESVGVGAIEDTARNTLGILNNACTNRHRGIRLQVGLVTCSLRRRAILVRLIALSWLLFFRCNSEYVTGPSARRFQHSTTIRAAFITYRRLEHDWTDLDVGTGMLNSLQPAGISGTVLELT